MDDELLIEIAYEAELNTAESPELLELARDLVHEDPDTRGAALAELREMIYERGECTPRRLDDAFLLRFLRARKFIVPRAHRLLVRYCGFQEKYPDLYKGVDLFELGPKVGAIFEGIFLDNPEVGRVSITRFGFWEPDDVPIEDLVRGAVAAAEIGLRQPKLQVLGGVLIMDLDGLTMRHVAKLTPTVVYQMVCITGLAIPTTVRALHFINYSWILHTFIYLFQRYMGPGLRKRTFFHGNDVKSLQQHIAPAYLPVRYGGTLKYYHNSVGHWFSKIKQYQDEAFVNEMKEFGYIVKE